MEITKKNFELMELTIIDDIENVNYLITSSQIL
jgi:hypothetical protein